MTDSSGRVAIVTGGTSGIGRVVAEGLAAKSMTTVIVGRGEARTASVAREIAQATQNPEVVPVPVSDLALRSEAHRLASLLRGRYPRISVLVNNAGAYFHRREVTADGLERTFALNVLAPFILTRELADPLAAGAPSRMVEVASEAHRGSHVPFDDLQSTRGYRGFRAYGQSKLELMLLTREFARRFGSRGISVNAVHPGYIASGFGRNNRGAVGVAMGVLSTLFGRSVRRGAEAEIFAATDPSLGSASGVYIVRRSVRSGSPASRDEAGARRLFEACSELADAAT